MARVPSVEITVHNCEEFEKSMETARFPKNENGNIGRVSAVIMRMPNGDWTLRFVDAIEMSCWFCPFCGKELLDG